MATKKKAATEPEKMTVKSKSGVASTAGNGNDGESPSAAELQLQRYEEAYRLFRSQNYPQAKVAFERAIEGPQRELTHNARLHVAMCERRMQSSQVEFPTAEEHYNYAIASLHPRNPPIARRHFEPGLA